MSKFEYTEEMVERMHQVANSTLTEEAIEGLMAEFEFPRRSVTAKLRKLGYDVPKKPGAAPVFSADESEALANFLDNNPGKHTAEEIAEYFSEQWGREVSARQINGKALSMEKTSDIRPAEKKVAAKAFTDAQEAQIVEMAEAGAFIEDIAQKLDRPVNSIRGKLLSLGLKAPQRDKKAAKADPYEGIEDMLESTVEDIANAFGKTPRGVRTVLTRRGLSCADYSPKAAAAE
jgi:hypothetical protein